MILISALGFAASAAAQASAGGVTASAYPSTVTLAQLGVNAFSNGVREVSCPEATFLGELTGPSESIVVAPAYAGCTGNAGTTETINTNGCIYAFGVGAGAEAPEGPATTTISCPAGKAIEVDIWASSKSHSEAKLCRLTIGSQGPLAGATYKNVLGGIEFALALTTLKILRTEGTAANCGAAEKTNGTYTGTLKASSTRAGEGTGLMVG